MGNPIEEERFESYTTTDLIKEKGYGGMYLYCKYTDINTKREYKTEHSAFMFVSILTAGNKIDSAYKETISSLDDLVTQIMNLF